jgi:hypothetical protein
MGISYDLQPEYLEDLKIKPEEWLDLPVRQKLEKVDDWRAKFEKTLSGKHDNLRELESSIQELHYDIQYYECMLSRLGELQAAARIELGIDPIPGQLPLDFSAGKKLKRGWKRDGRGDWIPNDDRIKVTIKNFNPGISLKRKSAQNRSCWSIFNEGDIQIFQPQHRTLKAAKEHVLECYSHLSS